MSEPSGEKKRKEEKSSNQEKSAYIEHLAPWSPTFCSTKRYRSFSPVTSQDVKGFIDCLGNSLAAGIPDQTKVHVIGEDVTILESPQSVRRNVCRCKAKKNRNASIRCQ
jgi:hypothetical protein